MRRIATTIAAGFLAAAALATPAQAQTNYFELIRVVNGNVAGADCNTLGAALRGTGFVKEDTTRSGLVKSLTDTLGDDASLRLLTAGTINAAGDRALECGIVKPDPVTPQSQAIEMSSKLSSQAGLPEVRNLIPVLGL